MSARIMTKQCVHCHRSYTYNPSIGDLGHVCKHCGKSQGRSLPSVKLSQLPQHVPHPSSPWKFF